MNFEDIPVIAGYPPAGTDAGVYRGENNVYFVPDNGVYWSMPDSIFHQAMAGFQKIKPQAKQETSQTSQTDLMVKVLAVALHRDAAVKAVKS